MNPVAWLMAGFYVAIAVMILAHGIAIWREERAARHWIPTRGIIRFSPALLAAFRRGATPQRAADIGYEYTVAGHLYRSQRLALDSLSWHGFRATSEYLAGLRPGSLVTVYYDPARPQRAVLVRQTSAWDYLAFIATGLVVLVVGLYLFHLL